MIAFLITRGGAFTDGWFVTWFTHGLGGGQEIISPDSLTPMFFPRARAETVPGDPRKVP